MIIYVVGDLFQSPAKVLVNAVNTSGAMGTGDAAQFKRVYPAMFATYKALCDAGRFEIGQLMLHQTPHKWVLNFPTQRHGRSRTAIEDIVAGLQKFVATYAEKGITSASFPMLGADGGRLDWEADVRPLLEAYLGPLPITIYIHRGDVEDPFAPERRSTRGIRSWLQSQPQVVDFARFWRDLSRVIKHQAQFKTLDGSAEFRVAVDDSRRRSLTIFSGRGDTIFVPETMLVDLWLYVRSAGYSMPHNLPGGLDVCTPYFWALLAGLDYVRPVLLSWDDKQRHVGLHVIPPVDRKSQAARKITMTAGG